MSKLDSKRKRDNDIEIRRGNEIVTLGQRKIGWEEKKGNVKEK
jgi:hypothetical protein